MEKRNMALLNFVKFAVLLNVCILYGCGKEDNANPATVQVANSNSVQTSEISTKEIENILSEFKGFIKKDESDKIFNKCVFIDLQITKSKKVVEYDDDSSYYCAIKNWTYAPKNEVLLKKFQGNYKNLSPRKPGTKLSFAIECFTPNEIAYAKVKNDRIVAKTLSTEERLGKVTINRYFPFEKINGEIYLVMLSFDNGEAFDFFEGFGKAEDRRIPTVSLEIDEVNAVPYFTLPLEEWQDLNEIEWKKKIGLTFYSIAIDFDKSGEYENAIKFYSKALENLAENKEKAEVYCERGIDYYVTNQIDKALSDLAKTTTLSTDKEEKARALYFSSLCYRDLGKDEVALKNITKAIETFDSKPGYYLLRGKIYLNSKKYEQAMEDFCRVAKMTKISAETNEEDLQVFYKATALICLTSFRKTNEDSYLQEIRGVIHFFPEIAKDEMLEPVVKEYDLDYELLTIEEIKSEQATGKGDVERKVNTGLLKISLFAGKKDDEYYSLHVSEDGSLEDAIWCRVNSSETDLIARIKAAETDNTPIAVLGKMKYNCLYVDKIKK